MPAEPYSPLLILAHPGHELSVYGWLSEIKPKVCILTNGAGHSSVGRIDSTNLILDRIGSGKGSLYGEYTDRAVYNAILAQDIDFFTGILDPLIEDLLADEISYVVGDAREGFNPIHDMLRTLLDIAVYRVNKHRKIPIENYDFVLFSRQENSLNHLQRKFIRCVLSESLFQEKLSLANQYPELQSEVRFALKKEIVDPLLQLPMLRSYIKPLLKSLGPDAYRVECLRLVDPQEARQQALSESLAPCFYDLWGELLTKMGRYQTPICYRKHILPLNKALYHRFVC